MIEITSASNSYQSGITGNRIADGINITRVGKVSTSGITDPAGIVGSWTCIWYSDDEL